MLNLGCIEFNPWNSRLHHLETPDWAVIDLDPEAVSFEAVIQTARTVHAVLDELGIAGYPKTSGATGLHIYIPLGAKYTYDQSKLFAELIANLAHQRLPEVTSVERLPKKRQGKVYLDFLQNRRGQTLAQAYSVRPRPGATVSTPLHWDEVKTGLSPGQFTLKNTPARLNRVGDLWKPVLGPAVKLNAIISQIETS
jgi:bifunctional non-homologous end joining protein LigD